MFRLNQRLQSRFKVFLGYYRRFMEGYSSIATSLIRLTQKNILRGLDECKMNFLKLKALLTSTPIATLSIDSHGFTTYSDAFVVGLGCVLMY